MTARKPSRPSVRLSYTFGRLEQRGAEMDRPLFASLAAVLQNGSISQAAKTLGHSYRQVWGELRAWEAMLGEPLVVWQQGQPAQVTAFGKRLLWAELRARKRMQPHVEALRDQLGRIVRCVFHGIPDTRFRRSRTVFQVMADTVSG